jgi:xylulokinase
VYLAPLEVERPRPLWAEQDPEAWWRATCAVLRGLRRRHTRELAAVRGVGLSGQMHGATLLDAADRVLRPAILWNDGRSAPACGELERRAPDVQSITGNLVMPGFTAPKLLWVAEHEPEIFARVARVLLPKDYLRLRLSGDHASEMSDAAGTLWLDVARRAWSEPLLEATGLGIGAMPSLFEGSAPTGQLRSELAREWGMDDGVVIAGGAGDQAAGAAGAGVVEPGQALLALGTSGVFFVAGDRFAPNPKHAVHAFCHCLPGRWHQMSVILSAASCLAWVTRLTGARDEAELLAEIEAADRDPGALLFLPYLSGERTPHNDPHATGVFFGLTHATERADLGRAVLEGVAFALADGQAALREAGARIDRVSVIGGGARNAFWGRILASVLDRSLCYAADAEVGPAFGAARLARLAVTGEEPGRVCVAPRVERMIEPAPALRERLAARIEAYRRLYAALRERFAGDA